MLGMKYASETGKTKKLWLPYGSAFVLQFMAIAVCISVFAHGVGAQETAGAGQEGAAVPDDNSWLNAFPDEGQKSQELSAASNAAVSEAVPAARRYRQVTPAPQFGSPSAISKNEKLYLNLFENTRYVAVVDRVAVNVNGTVTVRARIEGYPLGYFLISTTDGKSLATVTIPEQDAVFQMQYLPDLQEHVLLDMDTAQIASEEDAPALIPPPEPPMPGVSGEPTATIMSTDPLAYATINVMILYTTSARTWADASGGGINNIIAQCMERSQLVLDNSETVTMLRLVHSAEVDYTETGDGGVDLRRLTFHQGFDPGNEEGSPYYMDHIHDLRSHYAADLTAMFVSVMDSAGIAWVLGDTLGSPSYGFSITTVQSAGTSYTNIHEMGHNLGCGHHKEQNFQAGPGIFDYSAGWRWADITNTYYCSVMTYTGGQFFADGMGSTHVPYFSNPTLFYEGIATGHATHGNNARTIRETKHAVAGYRVPLGKALEHEGLAWNSTGGRRWFGQSRVSIVDGDAAQSGAIVHNQGSWLQTTVTGPGTLRFRWKVSSEANYDFLRFYVDGYVQWAISGEIDWQLKQYALSAGEHSLAWAYSKDGSVNNGSDCGWVDYVYWVPEGCAADSPYLWYDPCYQDVIGDDPYCCDNYWDPICQDAYNSCFLAPVATAATGVSITTFRANWNAVGHATGYFLDVSTNSSFTSLIPRYNNLDVGPITDFNVTGLASGIQYWYRVRAYNIANTTVSSNTISVTTAPIAPSATAATNITDSSFRANRSSVTGATGYRLDVSSSSSFSSFIAGYNDLDVGMVSNPVITGLYGGQTCYYRWRAYNASATSANSNVMSVTLIPGPPTATAATDISENQFKARWSNAIAATGYRLDVSLNSSFSSFVPGYNNLDVGISYAYMVTGLNGGTPYYYRIRAYNGSGTSVNSNTISVTTRVGAPTATAATNITTSTFQANWNVSPGATGYRLDVSVSSTFANFLTGYNDLDVGNVTHIMVTGNPFGGLTYYYRLRAYDASGTSSNSNSMGVTTAPSAPVATSADTISFISFKARWYGVMGALGYRLDVATDSAFTNFVPDYNDRNVGNTTFSMVTGLLPGTTYYYRVRAFSSVGSGDNSNTITVMTGPAAPVATAATNISSYSLRANWNSVASATGYRISVAYDPAFQNYVPGYSVLDVGDTTSHTLENLTPMTAYYYAVMAYNSASASPLSNVIAAGTGPAAPVATAANNITNASFRANWSASSGATGYRLDVSTSILFSSFVSGYNNLNVGATTNFTVTGLSGDTTYYYRVRAYNGSGPSDSSNSVSVTTLVPAMITPVTIAATRVTASSFRANWNSVAYATGYRLDVATDSGFTTMVDGYNNIDAGNNLLYSVTGLAIDTMYYYRVRAYNAYETTGNSNTTSVKTLLPALTAPTATAATNVNSVSFGANWTSVAGAAGYYLDVSTSVKFFTFVTGYNNLDVGNVTNHVVLGLHSNTNYYYRVRAYNAGDTSVNSNIISVTTPAPALSSPTANAATNIAQTAFRAGWTSVRDATGYHLDVALDVKFRDILPGYHNLDVGLVTARMVTGLDPGTIYYYRVRAYNGLGSSDNSNTISVATAPLPPEAPVAIAADAISSYSFNANWTTSANATSYRLDVSASGSFDTMVAGYDNLAVGNATNYTVTGLSGNTFYYYRVRAFNISGVSGDSNTITTCTAPAPPLAIPADSITGVSFRAKWNAAAGATGYCLDVSTNNSFSSFVSTYNNFNVGLVVGRVVSGLDPATTYYYRVRAYNLYGTSEHSNVMEVITVPVAPVTLPAQSVTDASFTARWESTTGATGYRLDVALDVAFITPVAGYAGLDVGAVTSWEVPGLSAGTGYYYRLHAYNSGGASGYSDIIQVITIPAAPVAVAANNIGASSFSANWDIAVGAAGYLITVAEDSAFTMIIPSYDSRDVGAMTTCTVEGLEPGTEYYYRVRAYNNSGDSAVSNTISVVTVPAAPVATAASELSDISFHANWEIADGATSYLLDVATDATFALPVAGYENLDVGAVNVFSVTGLNPYETYYYRVRAVNDNGTSVPSNTVQATTLPEAPVAEEVVYSTESAAHLMWNSVNGATGYRLDLAEDVLFTQFVGTYNDMDAGDVVSFTATGLEPCTPYYFRVRAYNNDGVTRDSNAISFVTLSERPASITVPETDDTGGYSVLWDALPVPEVSYVLEESIDGSFLTGTHIVYTGSATTFLVTEKVTGIYYYRVKAVNAGCPDSDWRVAANGCSVTLTCEPPGDITFSSVTPPGDYTVYWQASTTPDITYTLEESTKPDFSEDVHKVYAGVDTSFQVVGQIPCATYYYRVKATRQYYVDSAWQTSAVGVPLSFMEITACTPAPAPVLLNDDCVTVLADFTGDVETTDSCGVSVITQIPPAGTLVGTDTVVTLYATDDTGRSVSCEVLVSVIDDTPPIITLLGSPVVQVECGGNFSDPGVIAEDSCDGNLTAGVHVVNTVNTSLVGAYAVVYNVSDASANAAVEVTRLVNVVDTTAPTITLNGPAAVTVYRKQPYVDAGAQAWDACDGNLTAAIEVAGATIDTSVLGVYYVHYNVQDASLHAAAEKIRQVEVIPALPLSSSGPPDQFLAEGQRRLWSVVVNGGLGVTTCQWQRLEDTIFVNVEDGLYGTGKYQGAATATLYFAPFTEAMAGIYRVEISDEEVTIYSREAEVTFNPAQLPVSSLFVMIALASASAVGGALALRRRK